MVSTKKLVKPESGYGVIGVNVFFSVADIYRLRDIIDTINKGGTDGEEAMRWLINLHTRLADAISKDMDSVFTPDKVECYEIDNRDIKL